MNKKIIVILMLAALLLTLPGCRLPGALQAGREEQSKSLKIGICIYDHYDTFISSIVEDIQDTAKRKEREEEVTITVEVVSAGLKQTVQNDQVSEFIDKGCDIICINLVDRTDASVIIDRAKTADVPVIFFNRELVQEDLERWEKLYYVGAVAQESGQMQGQIVVDLCREGGGITTIDKNGDGKIQYVILEGEAGHQDALVRSEGSVKAITDAGYQLEKLGNEIANWKRAQAKSKVNQWLAEFGDDIELVLANNDDMALGAIDAWKDSGREQWPIIVGIDGTEPALEEVEKGFLNGTVLNDAKGQAESILELAYSLHYGTPLPEMMEMIDDIYIRLPYRIITAENVEEIMALK